MNIRSVGQGWLPLLEEYIPKIEQAGAKITRSPYEKYGSLRISVDIYNDEVQKFLGELETKSETVCELCGKPGRPLHDREWIKTLCDDCAK